MTMNRRKFNKLILSTSALTLIPKHIFAAPYNRPINWAGTSFLVPSSRIGVVMPIIKKAFEVPSEIMQGATFFNASLYKSMESKPIIKNLVLDGFNKDAKLALTLGFASEFDFGGFDDLKKGKYFYLIRSFAHSILYNPEERLVVSSVPVRAKISGKGDIALRKEGWKSKVMKESFYNDERPEITILEQFRIMSSKISLTNKWRGKAPRVTSVTFSNKNKKLFNDNFKLKFEDFIEFLGQSCTAAFSYKLNLPIIPYSVTESAAATISVFNDTEKMFQEVETALPNTEISIRLHHKGWMFKEKPLTPPMQQVTLFIGLKIEIFDVGFDQKLFSQTFTARNRGVEDMEGTTRSDAGAVCTLTEGLIERAFKSIVDDQYRKKMAKGDILIKGSAISERYKLIISKKIPNHLNKINQQSKDVMDVLKNL